jgi:hypothetical protein
MSNRLTRFLSLFRRRVQSRRRYFLNGKEISEAEWCINGGLDAERELAEAMEEMDRIFKRPPV